MKKDESVSLSLVGGVWYIPPLPDGGMHAICLYG